jgi:hypothetical protein
MAPSIPPGCRVLSWQFGRGRWLEDGLKLTEQ